MIVEGGRPPLRFAISRSRAAKAARISEPEEKATSSPFWSLNERIPSVRALNRESRRCWRSARVAMLQVVPAQIVIGPAPVHRATTEVENDAELPAKDFPTVTAGDLRTLSR